MDGRLGWQQVMAAPRVRSGALRSRDVPAAPGVYAWFRDGACIYIGKATSLRQRLRAHRATSRDLSRSTLRASVGASVVGIPRSVARQRPSVMAAEQVDVVNRWLSECEVAWLSCSSADAADALERRLRIERMPLLNRM